MKKYTFEYHESIFTDPDKPANVIEGTKTTWESDNLDDVVAFVQYFNTLEKAYKANGLRVRNVSRNYKDGNTIYLLGVEVDNSTGEERCKVLNIHTNNE